VPLWENGVTDGGGVVFAQVITGEVRDATLARGQWDRWLTELAPGVEGWLESTTGVTADGRLAAVVLFESAEAARRNRQRPDQVAWWREMATLFEGQATFENWENVLPIVVGDLSSAGFVQVVRGRVSDVEQLWKLRLQVGQDQDLLEEGREYRPDILGNLTMVTPDGRFTIVIYFTSEAEARAGEVNPAPARVQANREQLWSLWVGDPEFLDLREPRRHVRPSGPVGPGGGR
jgi:hypothetical protein